jgi:excisionase family DNA binding protein
MTVRAIEPPADENHGITLQETGRLLGVTVDTVRKLIEREQLEAWRIVAGPRGGRIRVRLGSVLEYRERHAMRGRGAPSMIGVQRSRVRHSAAHKDAVRFINGLGSKR